MDADKLNVPIADGWAFTSLVLLPFVHVGLTSTHMSRSFTWERGRCRISTKRQRNVRSVPSRLLG
jgi:hypothetical protein